MTLTEIIDRNFSELFQRELRRLETSLYRDAFGLHPETGETPAARAERLSHLRLLPRQVLGGVVVIINEADEIDALEILAQVYGVVPPLPATYINHCSSCQSVVDEDTKITVTGSHFCSPMCWDAHDAAQYEGSL